ALAQYYLQSNEFQPAGRRRKKPFLPACNFFCDRRLFEASGGFPEIRASEDTLFCLKLSKIVPVWFVPEARVHHVYRERWDGFFRAQTLTGRYIFLYRRDHYGDWYYRGAWPLFFLPAFLAIKFFRIAGRIFRAGPGPFFGWILCLPVFLVGLALWGWGFACAVPAARAKDAP
ncbi:MAG TPA: hypothetical protein VL404_03825, partial [Candidatus Eisenbacteria bacterium]|nr:hypothetical protein [Candidatus Eisenbacteria bacterium]